MMRLTSPRFPTRRFPTEEQLRRAFHRLDQGKPDGNSFLILEDVSGSGQGYIQTMREEFGYLVEARDAHRQRHYRLKTNVPCAEATRLFRAFLHRGIEVLALADWDDVTEEVAAEVARQNAEEGMDD